MTYDVAIVGLGATGAAAAYQLAKRGARVLAFDQFSPPHTFGSSHGETRITRLAIGEGDHLTPFAIRSHEIWRDIEQETGTSLLATIGGLVISSEMTVAETHVKGFFRNTLAAAKKFGIPHELLDAGQIRKRFPQFRVQGDEVGYFEPSAGYLRPEECIRAQLALAKHYGADVRTEDTVYAFEPASDIVKIRTAAGEHAAAQLILAAGPWLPRLLDPKLADLFKVYRQIMLWFEVTGEIGAFKPPHFPIFIWELRDEQQGIYGFPLIGSPSEGMKFASEQFQSSTDPEGVDRTVSDAEIAAYVRLVVPHLPGVGPRCLKAATCLYTVTPDFGFVLDKHPESDRVIIASPCSGHGFKHSAAIGEALAEMILDGASRLDLGPLRLSRFHGAQKTKPAE